MNVPSLNQIEQFIQQAKDLSIKPWNGPIPTNVKQVNVLYNGNQKVVNIHHMGSIEKNMDIWRIDLDVGTIVSSTYRFSSNERCVIFNYYFMQKDKQFELYKGPKQFAILECH
tara:strand:- start:315 stop:653 length:339 start_codon:yes stop_codon:yes gene_type:complete